MNSDRNPKWSSTNAFKPCRNKARGNGQSPRKDGSVASLLLSVRLSTAGCVISILAAGNAISKQKKTISSLSASAVARRSSGAAIESMGRGAAVFKMVMATLETEIDERIVPLGGDE